MPETVPSTSAPAMIGAAAPLVAGCVAAASTASPATLASTAPTPLRLSTAAGASPMPEIDQPPPEGFEGIRVRFDFHHRLGRRGCRGLRPAYQIHLFVAPGIAVEPRLLFR